MLLLLIVIIATHHRRLWQIPHSSRLPVSTSLAPGNEKDGERLEQIVGMLGVLKSFLVGLLVHDEILSRQRKILPSSCAPLFCAFPPPFPRVE